MKKIILSTCALLCAAALSYAQAGGGIAVTGAVADSASGQPVAFATLKLFAQGSEKGMPIKAEVADGQGKFKFSGVPKGKYTLQAEFVGKTPARTAIDADGSRTSIDIGAILMADNSLQIGDVTVTAQKPLVKVDLDKITYDLKEDPESQTSDVLEMLKKVPMVTVDGEENVQLKGSSNFKFYLNGKPSNMLEGNAKDVLKSIPASTIKHIEVITDPGAKYDAEGVTGIINIVTESQSALGGYTASVRARVSVRPNGAMGGGGGTYFSIKYGKLGITGNFSYNQWNNGGSTGEISRINYKDPVNYQLTQRGEGSNKGAFLWGSGEVSYEIDTLNLINVNVNLNQNPTDQTNEERYTALMQGIGGDTVYQYRQKQTNLGRWGGPRFGADYQRTFAGVKDRLLTLSYMFGYSGNPADRTSQTTPIIGYAPAETRQSTDPITQEHTFQADFTTPIAKIHTIEAGAKYIRRINQSSSKTEISNGGDPADWQYIPSDNDEFLHTQDIAAVYGSYGLKAGKWGFKAGARYEGTWQNVEYATPAQNMDGISYQNIVPSVTATYQLQPSQTLRLGYNMRIQRPGIWQLNPYTNTVDSNFIRQGNPKLDAVQVHNISLNYNLFTPKFNTNINLWCNFANNGVIEFTEIRDSRSYTTFHNIARERTAGLSGYASWTPITKLRLNCNVGVIYTNLQANNGSGIANSGLGGYAWGGVQYTLPLDFVVSVNGNWFKNNVSLQGTYESMYFHNLTLSRDFLDKKLSVRLMANNPFKQKQKFVREEKTPEYYLNNTYEFYTAMYAVAVSFRFGEMKAQIKKAQRTIQNEDQMSGGGGGGGEGGGGQ